MPGQGRLGATLPSTVDGLPNEFERAYKVPIDYLAVQLIK